MEKITVILYWNESEIGKRSLEFESIHLMQNAILESIKWLGKSIVKSFPDLSDDFLDSKGYLDTTVMLNDKILLKTKSGGRENELRKIPLMIPSLSNCILRSLKSMQKMNDLAEKLLEHIENYDDKLKDSIEKRKRFVN